MTMEDLNHEQLVALAALIERITISDGTVSEGEAEEINVLVENLGEQEFRALLDEAEERFEDEDDLKAFFESIEDQEAGELIYGIALDEYMSSPTLEQSTPDLLDWLADTWNIDVSVDDWGQKD